MLLRDRTREAHERVEAAFETYDVAHTDGYARFLLCHAAVLPAVEEALTEAGAQALLPDWPRRKRTDALLADLAQLELAPPTLSLRLALNGREQVLGALYVLEGSRLGSKLLLARAKSNAALPLNGGAYLTHGSGERFWPDFLDLLRCFEGNADAVVEGALTTFDQFRAAASAELR